ncbi:diguanylate cyclase (GGDEF)-like protein [Fluviicoccus keumensis]|uniref:diguanylate cyclase n=1 Tax=Fluviicoccus keumensis TaxID=1435465 RepID=A0A4Q7ZCU6_9GAMM|nr:diguanylate cyclase [Fluviicoccus keumensis]RZU48034.1 diguanylate cyclase (GGDEF)-like protein [Fluviicoccus keumensis]
MTSSRSGGDRESRIRDIQSLLASNLQFRRFRPELEEGFIAHVRDRAQRLSRDSLWITIIMYLVTAVLGLWQVDRFSDPVYRDGNLAAMAWLLVVEGFLLAFVLSIPYLPGRERFYRLYASFSSGGAVGVLFYGASLFPEPYFNVFISYVVILATVVTYGVAGLVTRHTAVACLAAVLLAIAAIRSQGLWLDLGYLLAYGGLANAIGILLSFLLESRDRVTFLQSQLLALEKDRLDEYAAEVEQLSRQDALTGLANRRCFDETVTREWGLACRRQESIAVIFLDVDFFKPYNDTYGHPAGDAVLRQVGRALAATVGRPADLAARYGGEEFVVLLPDTDLDGAHAIAERMAAAIAALAIPHGRSAVAERITVSMGVAATTPTPDSVCGELIDAADQAVYAAKAAGRNRIVTAA